MLKAEELREIDANWIKELGKQIIDAHGDFQTSTTMSKLTKNQQQFLKDYGYSIKNSGMGEANHYVISWEE